MMEFRNAELLRIYVGEKVRLGHRPLYEEIVREARLHGMAGATAMKGVLSFGHDLHLHTAKVMEFAVDLPMVIELVDGADRVDSFLEVVENMVRDARSRVMVTRTPLRTAIIE